ncbi:MAG: ATP-binding cassette domain-containing protein, partial [Candidatus Bathyarchaeia archaeon]
MSILESKNVKAYYSTPRGYVKAVDGVNITLDKGIILGLAGESGCGKSTLVNTLMMNIYPPLHFIDGEIILDGKRISDMDRAALKKNVWGVLVALVPQSALNALMPTKRVIDLVKDVVMHHMSVSNSEVVSMAKKRFEELNLDVNALYLYPHELSGGMKQRAVIAISTLL